MARGCDARPARRGSQVRGIRRRWTGLAISAGLSTALILGVASAADPTDASAVTVEGNRRLDADMIRSQFAAGRSEQQLDAAAIDAGLKALYATGQFQD